jgi:DNA-binding protein HU-beta
VGRLDDDGRIKNAILWLNNLWCSRKSFRILNINLIFKDKEMKKTEFIDALSEVTSLSKADATRAVESMLDIITDTLKKGDQIVFTGFGTFMVRKRESRSGRNPRTGETIQIEASNVPAFKAGKALKDALN